MVKTLLFFFAFLFAAWGDFPLVPVLRQKKCLRQSRKDFPFITVKAQIIRFSPQFQLRDNGHLDRER